VSRPGHETRILLIDDSELFRAGVGGILAAEHDLGVVGQAPLNDAAIVLAQHERPDIVLLDVGTRADQAERYLGRLLRATPDSRVIVLTMHDDAGMVRRLVAAGVCAYMLKSATRDELLALIRATAAGSDRTTLSVSRTTLSRLEAQERVGRPGTRSGTPPLSARELEVLTRLAHGVRNAELARQLGIAEGTVKRHLTNIYSKLSAASRMDAVAKAIARNLIPLADLEGILDAARADDSASEVRPPEGRPAHTGGP
jgi:DNA-binding NarL/FixJ family response regulator